MLTQNLAKRLLAAVLSVTLPLTSTYVTAESLPDPSVVGRQSQDFARELLQTWESNTPALNNGVLSMPGGQPLNVNDLYPGTSSSNERPPSFFFPDAYSTDTAGYEGVHNSDAQMHNQGSGAQGSLWDDAQQSEPTVQGAAYKVLLDMMNRSRPDFRNDPMMHTTRSTMDNIEPLLQEFGDCSEETVLDKTLTNVHVAEYERCERLFKPEDAGECTLKHEVAAERFTFDVYIGAPGRNSLTVRFDLKNGSWQHVAPTDGDQRTAVVPTVSYNSVCRDNYVASRGVLLNAYDWTGHGYPGAVDTSVNYNVIQHPSCDNDLVGVVQIQDTDISDDTDFLLGGQFSFAIENLTLDEWYPQECAENAKYIDDGFCNADITINDGLAPGSAECLVVGAVSICPGDAFYNAMQSPPTQKVSKLTLEAYMGAMQCDYNVGQMDCWTDLNGETQCPFNAGELLTTCDELDANPQCGYIGSGCVEGARGASGVCYINEDTYDCGGGVGVPEWEVSVSYNCSGPIRCMGDDCIDITRTQNGDFAKTAALLNAAQFMGQDMACSEGAIYNPDDNDPQLGCTVFPGKAGDCKKAMGGIVNCCEKPEEVSLSDYISLIMALPKMDAGLVWLSEKGYSIGSSYVSLRTGVVEGFTEISEPFVSATDNITGVFDTVSESIGAVKEYFKDAVQEMLTGVFESVGYSGAAGSGGAAAGQVAGTAVTNAGDMATAFMQNAGSVLNFLGTVYTVYTLTMLAIKMIFKCTADEMEMNVKRVLKSCTYVGSYCKTEVIGVCIEKRESYCCFSSPLSRIIQEQARPQLGMDFGSPKDPQCGGLQIQQIGQINWDLVDLSEWLGLLTATGNYINADALNIPYLTGQGTTLDLGGRVDAEERAIKRLEGSDVDSVRLDVSRDYKPATGAPF